MKVHSDIVKGDNLANAICWCIETFKPIHILEIGSSNGTGSTKVIAEAIKGTGAQLYCIEMNDERFEALVLNTSQYPFVHTYNCASIGTHGMFERSYIEKYKSEHPRDTLWKIRDMDNIYEWYDNTLAQIPMKEIPEGIRHIKNQHGIEYFDLVLIDGSPFTALSELKEVYGSGVIVLDDTMDLKCYDCLMYMLSDKSYSCIFRDDTYRNGCAIFKKMNYADS